MPNKASGFGAQREFTRLQRVLSPHRLAFEFEFSPFTALSCNQISIEANKIPDIKIDTLYTIEFKQRSLLPLPALRAF